MTSEEWDIDYDLKAWGEWSRYQSGVKIGYPSVQPFMRMLPDNIGYVPDNWISEEYAMVVDVVVANLNPLHVDLFTVLKWYYLDRKNQRDIAKIMGWSVPKVKQKLSVGRDVVKGMIHMFQMKAANDDGFNDKVKA